METYTIEFNNMTEPHTDEFISLEAAKVEAVERMGYTGESVAILNEAGETVTRSQWFGVEPTEEEIESGLVLVRFGTDGYYQLWSDELENL